MKNNQLKQYLKNIDASCEESESMGHFVNDTANISKDNNIPIQKIEQLKLSQLFKNKITLDSDARVASLKLSDSEQDQISSPIVTQNQYQRFCKTICKSQSQKNKDESFESLRFMSNKVIFDRINPKAYMVDSTVQQTYCSDLNSNMNQTKMQ